MRGERESLALESLLLRRSYHEKKIDNSYNLLPIVRIILLILLPLYQYYLLLSILSLMSPAFTGEFFTTSATWEALYQC